MTWHSFHRGLHLPLMSLAFGGLLACSDLSGLAGKQTLPTGVPDPNSINTRAGALAMYYGALNQFQSNLSTTTKSDGTTATNFSSGAFVAFVLTSGLLTDELETGSLGGAQSNYTGDLGTIQVDTRQLPEGGVSTVGLDRVYGELQSVRNTAHLANAALVAYDTVDSPALRGQMYALEGYAIVAMAELYCSGVPLSTQDFHADFTYRAGSSTSQLLQAAIAKFDTAITLSGDSARILNLAQVGKGRAYLGLAEYDSAATAVASVPTTYSYQFKVRWGSGGALNNIFYSVNGDGGYTEVDVQGTNGLPYLSSGDPRSAGQLADSNIYGVPQYVPQKYGGAAVGLATGGAVILPVTVADGIEARLIQAEAEYHGVATGMGNWLSELNALRASAITPALPALADPGTDAGRVALLFQERAYWLYLTGHRQGDLRRQLRQYSQYWPDQSAVYPIGDYPLFNQYQTFGTDVTVPIPTTEHSNPLFTGCLSRGA